MGIRSKAKKIKQLLPIVGAGGNVRSPEPKAPSSVPAPPAPPEIPAEPIDVNAYFDEVVKGNPVVLFMKGSPSSPQCGFSANAAGILQSYGVDLHHVNVLADPAIRQGIKDYSNWPTIPQVYVGSEFLGGSDILMQMHESGELKELIEAATRSP